MVRLTGLEPTRRYDTSTSSWPVYQFQHSRVIVASPKKDCLIIIAGTTPVVNTQFPFFPIFFLREIPLRRRAEGDGFPRFLRACLEPIPKLGVRGLRR